MQSLSNFLIRLSSTAFYIGYVPVAPGSMASIFGVGIAFYLRENLAAYILTFVVITIIGFLVSGRMEDLEGSRDPSCVVIDEVAGVMIAFFALPFNWPVIITAYFLFRAFDMFKIYPVNRFEEMRGGVGIMVDDLAAGVYTNVTMHIAMWLGGMV